jgi:hypothetical protein
MPARFDDLSQLRMHAFARVRRVNEPPGFRGNAKNGMTCVQMRRHDATTVGNRRPHGPRSKSSSAALAASAFTAV